MKSLQCRSMRWLIEYVAEASSERKEDLLVFIAAKCTIPPRDLEKPLIMKFPAEDKTKMLQRPQLVFIYCRPLLFIHQTCHFLNTWKWLYNLRVTAFLQKVIED